jgi:homogentisate 1,2-dioxygenase
MPARRLGSAESRSQGEPGPLHFQSGFANHWATEALPGALPVGQNSPQRAPYGLYAEQLSGTAFTAPCAANRRSWLYRIRPAAQHGRFRPYEGGRIAERFDAVPTPPDRLRWDPLPIPRAPTDFVDGLATMAGTGEPAAQAGCAIHLYVANRSMEGRYFCSADGELLIVPQLGRLRLETEFGALEVAPQEIAVVARGVRFAVRLHEAEARGYVCENHGALLRLPDLGPIGSNGLANPRDFEAPVARYVDEPERCVLIEKFLGRLWLTELDHCPLDVVARHGNLAPYRYDLRRFNTIGSISYDHPDPSIFLVLQSPSDTPGVDELDFVIFPPRWLAMMHSFRPPWFHRNVASEFMGLVHGRYDAKGGGFVPGGASLHNCMRGHGPDAESYDKALAADTTTPAYVTDTMAFMFETRRVIRPTRFALEAAPLQRDYHRAWETLPKRFDPARRDWWRATDAGRRARGNGNAELPERSRTPPARQFRRPDMHGRRRDYEDVPVSRAARAGDRDCRRCRDRDTL